MRRREFLALLGGIAIAARPGMGRAQHPGRTRRIAILLGVAESDPEAQSRVGALRQELERLGWVDGRNIRIEQRWTGGDAERLRAYMVSDPVSSGFVESWAQPGGNITGFTSFESSMAGKWLQALKQMAPRVTQVTVVFNPETAASGGEIFLRPLEEAASSAAEIAGLGDPSASGGTTGLLVVPDIFTTNHRDEIIALAARQRLPALYPFRFFAASGGLMSYGIDTLDVFRRAASYVDRILKGAKVGELPVQGPAKFELAINMRTANSLGLTVPPSLLALADEVIE